jgi:hypothetical protein
MSAITLEAERRRPGRTRIFLTACCAHALHDDINARSPSADIVAAFRQGLKEAGFVDGENVAIKSRFAESNFARLPDLAADLVHDVINVTIATGATVSAVKVKPVMLPLTK